MVNFTPQNLDEIRARLPVSAVVARRVRLSRRGREWIGLSPFKTEKTPSFTVNDEKGFYHCFASGEHGDQFTFLMKTEGLDFPHAVEKLASEAGVKLSVATTRRSAENKRVQSLYAALDEASRFFRQHLRQDAGAQALAYLTSRGITDTLIDDFALGSAPTNRHALRDHLRSRGFDDRIMIEAGLLIHGDDIAEPYDRFWGRILFPITDTRGNVIAFGGRSLSERQRAKYVNSPQSQLFSKGSVLYMSDTGRQQARRLSRLVLVEGYMDVIAFARAGILEVAAPLGTAFGEQQLALAWRYAPTPCFCFDGDEAGQRAGARALEVVIDQIQTGLSASWCLLPAGMDPDDYLASQGSSALHELVERALSITDYLWQVRAAHYALTTPEGRAAFEKDLFATCARIQDRRLARHIRSALSQRIGEAFFSRQPPHRGRGRAYSARPLSASESLKRSRLARQMTSASTQQRSMREAAMLRTLINHPPLVGEFCEHLADLEFSDANHRELLQAILSLDVSDETQSPTRLRDALLAQGLAPVLKAVERNRLAEAQWPSKEETPLETARLFLTDEMTLHLQSALAQEIGESAEALAQNPDDRRLERLSALLRAREEAQPRTDPDDLVRDGSKRQRKI